MRRASLAALLALAACTTVSTVTTTASGPGPMVPPSSTAARSSTSERGTVTEESDATRRSRARLELASAYFERGQMTTALEEVKLAIQADPNRSEAYVLRGMIYASLGDRALAEESFNRALQLNPQDADAMHNLGWYLCQQRRYDEADGYFRRALAVPQYREAPRTLLAQGVCLAYAGKLEAAEQALARSLELDAGNPATAVNLSEVLYRRGQYERARFYIRRVNAQPKVSNAQTLWLAARIENRLGNRQGTREFGTQLTNRFPESPEAAAYQRGTFDE